MRWTLIAIVLWTNALAFAATPVRYQMTVAADGSADFKTVQDAVDAVSVHQNQPTTIHIKPGVYKELVRIGNNLTNDGAQLAQPSLRLDWLRGNVLVN